MKLYSTEDDFLIRRSNGLMLSNNDVKILENNHINYLECHKMEELIFMVEEYLNENDAPDLEELSIKLSNEKFYINKKNYKNRYNELLHGKNIFENRKRKEMEENDMKPKIRFINLKKELIDENLKINKMHGIFQKQILEAEKILKNKLSHLY